MCVSGTGVTNIKQNANVLWQTCYLNGENTRQQERLEGARLHQGKYNC